MISLRKHSWPLLLGMACASSSGCSTTENIADLRPGGGGSLSQGEVRDFNFSLARALEAEGQLQKAAQMYERLREQDPEKAQILHRLAITQDKLGNSDRAQELFIEAVAENPQDPNLLADYGYHLYLRGKFDEAETELRKAIEFAPAHTRAQGNLGLVLCHLGRFKEAKQAFARGGLEDQEIQMNVAYALSIQGRLDDARAIYAGLKVQDPSNEEVASRLGQIDSLLAMTEGVGAIAVTSQEAPRPVGAESSGISASRNPARATVNAAPRASDATSVVSAEYVEKPSDSTPVTKSPQAGQN